MASKFDPFYASITLLNWGLIVLKRLNFLVLSTALSFNISFPLLPDVQWLFIQKRSHVFICLKSSIVCPIKHCRFQLCARVVGTWSLFSWPIGFFPASSCFLPPANAKTPSPGSSAYWITLRSPLITPKIPWRWGASTSRRQVTSFMPPSLFS